MRESDHLEKKDRTKFSSGSIGIADLFLHRFWAPYIMCCPKEQQKSFVPRRCL